MGDHVTDRSATTKQRWQIATEVLGSAVLDAPITFAQAEAILKNKKNQKLTARESLRAVGIKLCAKHSAAEQIEQYFHQVFGHTLDLAGIQFPEKENFGTWMAAPPELDEDKIAWSVAKHFKVKQYAWKTPIAANIDRALTQKRPSGLYVFAHRGGDEPDVMHRKSYDQGMTEGFPFASIKEYLLMTGFHRFVKSYFMDKNGWTRTSSLWSDDGVVYGHWYAADEALYLDSGHRDNANPDNGLRELFLGNLSL